MILSVKRTASVIVFALIVCANEVASKPYQELLPKPGYVPVYIREGNTPLSEINSQLAEAFHELEVQSKIYVEHTDDNNETKSVDANGIYEYTDKISKIMKENNPATESDLASFDIIKSTN